jgi:hypothetical protein
MSMMRFGQFFREIAERETRSMAILDPLPMDSPDYLPADEYGFDELYCTEPKCDCRRVMINVLARHAEAHVATINHGFDPPTEDDPVQEQTFLDPLNKQSSWSDALLGMFVDVVLADPEYRQRLLRHYRIFKNAIDDPMHLCHRVISIPGFAGEAVASGKRRTSIPPPPPRRGKRRKW